MRVLIVDDNALNRLLPITWLSRLGYAAEESVDGHDALEKLQNERFDVVLLDLSMPRLSGMEVCRRLRAMPENAQLRIIAYTAHGSPGEIDAYATAGFDDVLIKPITREQLLKTLAIGSSPS